MAPRTPAPVETPLPVTDFVCEADIRAAMKEGRKIFIGPKTIITPAARDVTGASEILVMAQR